jgi:ankyrin repeat protein
MKKQQYFEDAVMINNIDFVKLLLKNEEVDPNINKFAILESCRSGYIEILQLLLNDKRINPTEGDKYSNCTPISLAAQNGHLDVVQLLLNDPRVDPSVNENNSIINASKNGHLDIVELLLKDKRVNPSDNNNAALCFAVNAHLNVVKVLLSDPRIDPSKDQKITLNAAGNGQFEITKFLLSDSRINFSFPDNRAIDLAYRNSHLNIVYLLWTDPLIKQTLQEYNEELYEKLILKDMQDRQDKINNF